MHQHSGIDGIIFGAFVDTFLMIPILFILYFLLEYFSHTKNLDLVHQLKISGPLGPLAGTILGLIPQCGMSVFVTSLFISRKVTIGTLIAAYLATSDEAIPVLLAHTEKIQFIGYLLGAKFAIAVSTGYLVDFFLNKELYKGPEKLSSEPHVIEIKTELQRTNFTKIINHALNRTFKIYFWVLAVTIILGLGISFLHFEEIIGSLKTNLWIEVLIASIFGLIPNCAASIAIAESFLHAGLSAGAVIAGLSVNAGYGPIILIKEAPVKIWIKIISVIIMVSIGWGLVINYLF